MIKNKNNNQDLTCEETLPKVSKPLILCIIHNRIIMGEMPSIISCIRI